MKDTQSEQKADKRDGGDQGREGGTKGEREDTVCSLLLFIKDKRDYSGEIHSLYQEEA